MKPILKIEIPKSITQEEATAVRKSLAGNPIENDYHVIVINGNSDFFHTEIITASDIILHLNK